MQSTRKRIRGCWLLLALAWPAVAQAQVFTGRVDVKLFDATDAVLQGATVEIGGPIDQSAVSDALGEAHFLNLPVGIYRVTAALDGFVTYVNESVPVEAGRSVDLRVTLELSSLTADVTVEVDTPVVDVRKLTTSTHVSDDELQRLPSSRDPWVVLQTIPGVIVDRVNVGGSESGQQSQYMSKGAAEDDNTWYVDGIPITDMAATGQSPGYYDVDQFQEVQVTTGGGDVLNPTPGVQLNVVLKSGTDVPRGSTRLYFSNEGMQSNNLSDQLAESIGGASGKGNRTEQFSDYGFEFGAPLLEGRAWAWGAAGRTDVRIRTLDDHPDRTVLRNYAFKGTAKLHENVNTAFTFYGNDKLKDGRGASPTRPPAATWDQEAPTRLVKGEATWIATPDLFVTARGSFLDASLALSPKGGLETSAFQDVGGVFRGSFIDVRTNRPQWTSLADANWFRGRHEVKFGFSWRKAVVESVSQWPGNGALNIHLPTYPQDGLMVPIIFRQNTRNTGGVYTSLYVADTISFDRLTVNVGARFDRLAAGVRPASAGTNPLVPDLFPELTTPARRDTHVVNTLTPRAGVTIALDAERKTLARASYSQFATQIGTGDAAFVSGPLNYSYVYYLAVDGLADGVRNGVAEREELLLDLGPLGFSGFDPDNPTATDTVNRVRSDFSAPRTHEIQLGVDREVLRDVAVSGTVTWRRFTNVRWRPLIGIRRDDFVEVGRVAGELPAGQGSYDVPFFAPRPDVTLPAGNGREEANREGYHQRYWGLDLSARKRLSNGWMGRAGFSTNSHREYFDDPSRAIEDPTSVVPSFLNFRFWDSPLADGGNVLTLAAGSGKSDIFFVLPRYQFVLNGMVEGPYGVNVGLNFLSRQGFAQPFFAGSTPVPDPATPTKNVFVAPDVGGNRLPTVNSLDVRLEKLFRIGRSDVIFDFDIFNLVNSGTVLGRQYDVNAVGATGVNRVLEIMSPRVLRVGFRINFQG